MNDKRVVPSCSRVDNYKNGSGRETERERGIEMLNNIE